MVWYPKETKRNLQAAKWRKRSETRKKKYDEEKLNTGKSCSGRRESIPRSRAPIDSIRNSLLKGKVICLGLSECDTTCYSNANDSARLEITLLTQFCRGNDVFLWCIRELSAHSRGGVDWISIASRTQLDFALIRFRLISRLTHFTRPIICEPLRNFAINIVEQSMDM